MADITPNNSRIAKNTLFLTIRSVVVMLVYLYTSRVILNTLGVEDYGVYSVIGGFVAMFGFLNGSLSAGVQRFYNFKLGSEGEDAMTGVYNAALRIQLILSATIFVLLETVGLWYLYNKMVLPPDRLSVAFWLFQFSMISLFLTIMQIPYMAAIMSHERMDYYSLVGIIDVFVNLGLVIALPFIPADKLLFYGIFQLARVALQFLLYFIYCKRHFVSIRPQRGVDRVLMKEMLTFSGWNVFGTFGGMAKDQGLNMILNLFFGPVVNAARGVAVQVSGAVNSLVSNIGVSVRPQLTGAYAQGDRKRAFHLMYSLTKISFVTLYMISLPIMVDIDYILRLWLGDSVPEHTAEFVVIVFLLAYMGTINAAYSAVIHSSGKMKTYQLVGCCFNIAILPIAYIFLKGGFSAEMAMWISFIVYALAQIPPLFILKYQEQMSIRDYLRHVAVPLALVVLTTVFIPFIPFLLMEEGFLRFVVIAFVSVVAVALSFYFIAANEAEKTLISNFVRKCFNAVLSRMKIALSFTRVQFFHLLALTVRPWMERKHYWVLHERGNDAQDNAWHLLRYLRSEHPEINVRYAIRNTSPDYSVNLQDYRDVVVEYDSLRYYLILFNADVLAATHIQCYAYPHNLESRMKGTIFDIRAKKVFLQHGVMSHKIKALAFPNIDVDIFICGAATEHALMMSEGMEYPPQVAKYTGLARFDNLWDCVETKSILVMPTWRAAYSGLSCDDFKRTDFFEYYRSVLTDPVILEKLEEKGYTICYYNHYEFQRFNSCFEEFESRNVNVVKFGSVKVQDLLKQAKVLMTDFSSVYYDFLYMGKPVVFSALSEDSFDATQYGRRYDGVLGDFGYTPKNVEETRDMLLRLLEDDCRTYEQRFEMQQKKVFHMRDRNNCERIYQVIKDLL